MDSGILVWFICLIPVFTTIGFYVHKRHEFVWWELFVPTAVSLLVTFFIKFITDEMNVRHDEVWNSNTTELYESDPWNEWIHQTCETCTTDSKGNQSCTSYDCSYQDDHGPQWYAVTDIGEQFNMTEHFYDSILNVWGKSRAILRTRSNHSSSSRASNSSGTKFANTRVGRQSHIYKSVWDNRDITRIPYSSRHTYENRIQASDMTVFDIKVVTPEEADTLGLFHYIYPNKGGLFSSGHNNGLSFPTILSQFKLPDSVQTSFMKLNGKFGPINRVRLWVLVYQDAPSSFGALQENYWVKGNFNEFVLCISVDGAGIIQWSHAFSWCLNGELPVEARNKVVELGAMNKQGWNNLYDWFDENLGRYDKRSHDEFSYITVEPPTWAIIMNLIISTLVAVGFNIWVTNNDIYETDQHGRKKR